ncbi:MAG: type I-E CRISPR-associated protein Cas6/Cse3/CasE [Actinomyces sp.]|uniref:type I-E CRISPR-associated protein Cas6/Cse3/CasE n=1 Tax=Actinomyces sp. TaxID=29317 RepID=UPI0026DC3483|nr:type I-E CRISPR-associated protein Cas6/Cse3/CasE [Actinomyces sp.]MDO4244097.1 type I-E CRISPR-associated protein Cas6/Cse3/CasE [Actinomyces sp.]
MFLTRIELDPGRRLARKYLGSPQVMHAVIMKAAGDAPPEGPGRVLWRVDRGATTLLYLLTPVEPDCEQILTEACAPGQQARTLDYSPFLGRLDTGQVWAFRLTANPSRAVPQGAGARGKRFGHVTIEQQRTWLVDRVPGYGFELLPAAGDAAESSLTVVRRARPVFGRENPEQGRLDRVTINQTVYEGRMRVTEPDTLRQALVEGIGRSKAYGCGLMTLARPHQG